MGYDISYHAISEDEISKWYFEALELTRASKFDEVLALATKARVEKFYAQKYKDTLSAALQYEDDEIFNKTHGFCIAVTQGFFRKYFYTRGTSLSSLARQNEKFKNYVSNWREILPSDFLDKFSGEIYNEITEHYCCGAYVNAKNVAKLKADYEADGEIKEAIDGFYAQNLPAFLDALNYACELEIGLLEATEVVEPNPLDLNKSSSYSNLFNCDTKGAIIYAQTAVQQIREAVEQEETGKKSIFEKIKGLFK